MWKTDVVKACTARFDLRLETLVSRDEFIQGMADLRLEMKADLASVFSDLRKDITDLRIESKQELSYGLSTLRQEMATQRVELLRWSFLFWIGQVAATAGLISLSLHFAR